jgi:fatty acyl-CoA reductase
VTGPLKLQELAKQCPNLQVFCQVSTLYSFVDRTGFIDERVSYPSDVDWQADYNKIQASDPQSILDLQKHIVGKFPNNYCYTKRMAEELLIKNLREDVAKGERAIPLVMVRPSIISASHSEPVPGWTDSLGLLSGFYAIAGHGILRDLPLNSKLLGD